MRKTVVVALTTTVLAATLTACGPETQISSSGASSAPTTDVTGPTSTPEGRISDLPAATQEPTSGERGVSGRASVEVPEGWTETRVDDTFDLRYLSGEGETDPLLSLAGDFGRFRMSRAAASTLIAQIQMGTPGFTIHSQEDVDVEGADNAVRVDFAWGTEEDGGVFEGMWVLAVGDDGHTIALAYSGGQDEISDGDKDRFASSFTMLPAQS